MVAAHPAVTEVWNWLGEIPDPEIPVLSILDLGIVREVRWEEDSGALVIAITPTYSGCPAMEAIAADIRSSMGKHGVEKLRLETRLSPPWTTDWMNDDAKQRLREYGIAPPLISISASARCPRCGSSKTQMVSRFGSTPCKALYKCLSCLEPFDVFKPH